MTCTPLVPAPEGKCVSVTQGSEDRCSGEHRTQNGSVHSALGRTTHSEKCRQVLLGPSFSKLDRVYELTGRTLEEVKRSQRVVGAELLGLLEKAQEPLSRPQLERLLRRVGCPVSSVTFEWGVGWLEYHGHVERIPAPSGGNLYRLRPSQNLNHVEVTARLVPEDARSLIRRPMSTPDFDLVDEQVEP